jgi:aryl-alcohol dehydrogenase-like predicted oxidoreductase
MRYVQLGQTDLKVSAIAFGTWAFGGDWGTADRHDSDAAIGRALELGITLFDTAQGYGFGAAEQVLAEALRKRVSREEVVIATKGGLRMQDGGLLRDASPGWLRQGVETSLRNLGTDYLDLYQLHWPDPNTPAAETAGALAELAPEGKIRHIGVSTTTCRRCSSSAGTAGWRRCSRPITCSGGPSRTRSSPMPPATTSAFWPTGRWPTGCSAAG